MKLFAVICVLLFAQLAAPQQCSDDEAESVPYRVVKYAEGYEERLYPAAKWVCYNATDKQDMKEKSYIGIFMYFLGTNDREEMIPMTNSFQVLMEMQSNDSITFKTCHYLPKFRQESPPLPTVPKMYIKDRPDTTYFVRSFGGYSTKELVWEHEFRLLATLLAKAKETQVDFTNFFSSGDARMISKNRINEVGYLKRRD